MKINLFLSAAVLLAVCASCGPDSEMFYFRSNDEIPKVFDPEDERWVEIWNDVFMQYYKDENGNITGASRSERII